MLIFLISITVWIITGKFIAGLSLLLFLYFLKIGFLIIDAVLSKKETIDMVSIIGLAWLIGSDTNNTNESELSTISDDEHENSER